MLFKQKLSGQSVLVTPLVTFKWGPGARAQGELMHRVAQFGMDIAPTVYAVAGPVYMMETLDKPRGWIWQNTAGMLKKLWAFDEEVFLGKQYPFDTMLLEVFIEEYDPPMLMKKEMLPMQLLASAYRNAREMTHGDPTEQNTLHKGGAGYRLIDWQWNRRPFVPAHRDVDYGKMLQSLIVNEQLPPALSLLDRSPVAWFWCCIHFMRIAKRDPALREWCDRQIEKCVWVKNRRRTHNVA